MIKEEQRFYFKDDEGTYAQVVFNINDNVLFINSLVTREDQRGKGLARILTDEIVNHAIENNFKVKPVCSYAIKYFEKNEHLRYLLVD